MHYVQVLPHVLNLTEFSPQFVTGLSSEEVIMNLERPRRLRRTATIRESVAETQLSAANLVLPFFVTEGSGREEPITTMPGISRWSLDRLPGYLEKVAKTGVRSIALFPKIDDAKKDSNAKEALNHDGLVPRTVREIKKNFPELTIYTDIALDPFSSDGHDGLVRHGEIVNDLTVEVLARMAVIHAEAGADFVSPSDMMDGRVGAMRRLLDERGFYNVGIMSYGAKYASCFYGPFRDALDSAPKAGDKKTYQMDFRNVREALREVRLDVAEGADGVMVKPAGAYLDVIRAVRENVDIPVAAYQVSGEYAMLKVSAEKGIFSIERAMEESIFAIRRAGADLIFTYFAADMATRLGR
jgi:porphobilinogen synthase